MANNQPQGFLMLQNKHQMAKQQLILSLTLQRSYAAEIFEAFKEILIKNGFDDTYQLSQMRLHALESDQIVVHIRHPTKIEVLSLSWQRHLANLAIQNIYHLN